MPSFFKSAALALASATFAAAQYSNGTVGSAVAVPGWSYLGCETATAATGALIDSSAFMTVERCLLAASAYNFARIHGNDCFGASSTNGTSPVSELSCNLRCGGNPAEACGGSGGSMKRQAVGTTVSVYQRVAAQNIPAGTIYTTIINNVYVDYCPSCVGGTTTVGYCSIATITACGCASQSTPSVSYTTVTLPCTVGGTSTTLTLTVPSGVTPGSATAATVTAAQTTVVACSTCPSASTATVGTSTVTVPAGSALTTVSYCPGCATGAGSVSATATPAVSVGASPVAATTSVVAAGATATKSSTVPAYTGAADSVKVGSGLLVGAMAVAALL